MSINQLAGEAILAACADAGLSVTEVDGLAFDPWPGPGTATSLRRASSSRCSASVSSPSPPR